MWGLLGRGEPQHGGGRECGARGLWAGETSARGPGCPVGEPRRIITALELLPQGLKLRVTLVARASVGIKRGLDSSHVCHLLADGLLRCLHARQTSVDIAGQARESFMRTPPFCASRFRCSDARTSPKASAIRKPGGCSGPP